MAGVARRLYADAAEIQLGSLFLDDINIFQGKLNSGFEVCEKVHDLFQAWAGSGGHPSASGA
jgi:hypothetical protein